MELLVSGTSGNIPRSRWLLAHAAAVFAFLYLPIAVLILYSFEKNERLRIKAQVGDGEPCPSVTRIWPTADWL